MLSHVPLVNAAPRGTADFDLDVADGVGPVAGLADLAFTEDFCWLVDGPAFLAGLRLAGFAGASIDPQASVMAETAVRRIFFVAFLRVRLNGSNI